MRFSKSIKRCVAGLGLFLQSLGLQRRAEAKLLEVRAQGERVNIARSLYFDVRSLFRDEPVAHLVVPQVPCPQPCHGKPCPIPAQPDETQKRPSPPPPPPPADIPVNEDNEFDEMLAVLGNEPFPGLKRLAVAFMREVQGNNVYSLDKERAKRSQILDADNGVLA